MAGLHAVFLAVGGPIRNFRGVLQTGVDPFKGGRGLLIHAHYGTWHG